MTNDIANPVKNIFSRAALKMLNACAKFAYNFAQGFGIRFLQTDGSYSIEVDREDEALADWIRDLVNGEEDTSTPKNLPSGAVATANESLTYKKDTAEWTHGESGAEILICCRATDDGVNGALFFRKARIDKSGRIMSISAEMSNYGAIVTG